MEEVPSGQRLWGSRPGRRVGGWKFKTQNSKLKTDAVGGKSKIQNPKSTMGGWVG
jgi:hypothetical protein